MMPFTGELRRKRDLIASRSSRTAYRKRDGLPPERVAFVLRRHEERDLQCHAGPPGESSAGLGRRERGLLDGQLEQLRDLGVVELEGLLQGLEEFQLRRVGLRVRPCDGSRKAER